MSDNLPRAPSANPLKRLAWLLACVFAGLIIGVIGSALSGSSAWYVAIPAVIAIGWFFHADPTACEPSSPKRANGAPGNKTKP
ncbi:MAG: hypothetical protein ABI790_08255 [Betaproteobacteria bacterium]